MILRGFSLVHTRNRMEDNPVTRCMFLGYVDVFATSPAHPVVALGSAGEYWNEYKNLVENEYYEPYASWPHIRFCTAAGGCGSLLYCWFLAGNPQCGYPSYCSPSRAVCSGGCVSEHCNLNAPGESCWGIPIWCIKSG